MCAAKLLGRVAGASVLIAGAFAVLFPPSLAAPLAAQIKNLHAPGPRPELKDKLMQFGQFAGDWECDETQRKPDGSEQRGKCEWSFGWILGGRAVQDVFLLRAADAKPGDPPLSYGTAVRFYDPRSDTWRMAWLGPVTSSLVTFVGRKVGDELVLDAQHPDDSPERGRWIFFDVKPDSFQWRAETSHDAGKTWQVTQRMSVRRKSASHSSETPD